ncbi:MAG: hypothetical protein M1823_002118 [Watsoniomyces obsoletus]|nr:MAG: hypothetical protein M1823_002118 [Watsoniomyces obsoletus]
MNPTTTTHPNLETPRSEMDQPSADRTAVPSPADSQEGASSLTPDPVAAAAAAELAAPAEPAYEAGPDDIRHYAPIEPAPTVDSSQQMPGIHKTLSGRQITNDDIFRILSKRRTNNSGRKSSVAGDDAGEDHAERAEIERLMSRMFGRDRQANSEEEQTRHVGLSFKNLTVTGMGLGAALQPTVGDILMGLPRLLQGLIKGGPRRIGAGKPPVRTLLNDFNGCVRPGEMLLVLGRPGAGCSTFLKVLGNQRFGYVDVAGDVTYGGTSAADMAKNYRGEVLYNPEDDLHYATLTVRQTLTFALKTRTPGKASRQEGESRADYVREFLRVVAKLFWIEHTMTTKVGNEFVRGVSGGEKKRVSIAEAMITKASTQCWDNSTRGLDASTALEYVESLRTLTNMAHVSTLVALYQAGESLYELFDKVVLIDEGRCIYYGPTTEAKAYFENLGFHCPPRCTTAEFLTSVVDRHEREIKPGWENRIPRTPDAFHAAYRASDAYRNNLADVADLDADMSRRKQERVSSGAPVAKKKNYTIPFYKQVLACTHRQYQIMRGDNLTLFGKWGGIVFQALIVGSLFFDMPVTTLGVFPRGGVLFFMLLFNALLALAELTSTFAGRPIMLKHKSFSFYRPSAYAIAQVVLDVPLVLVQVLIFTIIVYWMGGLRQTASAFFIAILILFFETMTMYSFFRAIGSLSRNLDIATRVTGVSIQALIVYTGYIIPPTKMRPWLEWLRYINPVAYGYEALMANEFDGLQIQCVPPNLVPLGPGALPNHQACTLQGSRLGETVVSGSDFIEAGFEYRRSHLWRNLGIIIAFWLFFALLTALGMEMQKPNKGGGAVTIFKRGQEPKSVAKALENGEAEVHDEEKGAMKEVGALDRSEQSSDVHEESAKGVAKNETVFTWSNVNYTIPIDKGERQLLQDVQGYVRPGKLTALMGASGAGKTTLLNVLAQRVTFGVVTGDFLVDGRPLPRSFQRATGFAEQMDVHEGTATVREACRFSALLRQPREVPVAEKYEYVERIISLLEMEDFAGATIGQIGAGLNQEQRKRVTIAVELAAKPELLMFLDEPTSGLDSGAAFNIVRFLRKLADAGQAILCTIHQPSAMLFEYFDELLLLKSGGRVVYHGPLGKDSRQLIGYFERNGAKTCPPQANPAEYMLEAIGAGNPDYKGQDWGEVWAKSPEYAERTREIQQMTEERRNLTSSAVKKVDDREFAMPVNTQVVSVVRRSFVSYWRNPDYISGKMILHIFTGLFNTFTFYKLGNSVLDMQLRMFSVFMTLTISPPLIQQLQPAFLKFRDIYKSREANSKIYSWVAFVTGAILVELPYSIVAGSVYFNCWFWGVGFPRDSYSAGVTWMFLMLFELYYVGFGQAIASFSPNELLASILVPVFFLFVVSFCGVVVPYAALPKFWQSWMYHITPFRYLLEGFLGVLVHNVPVECDDNEYARFTPPPNQTCQDYTQGYIQAQGGYIRERNGLCELCQYKNGDEYSAGLNVFYNRVWRSYGILFAFCIFNFAIVYFCSWLYLIGGRKIKQRFTAKKTKTPTQRPAATV